MGTDQVIYIRTDGNAEIASGHIMRCLTIANACQKRGAKAVFIVADAESEALLCSRMNAGAPDHTAGTKDTPFPIINLCTDYHDAEEELPILCQVLMSYPCTALLIDSYFVNPGYLETLSRLTHVAYMDDLYSFPYPVQTVINYDISPDPDADCYRLAHRKLLGPAYTPLREMFEQCTYTVRPTVRKILLMAGGMDNGHFFVSLADGVLRHYAQADTAAEPFSPAATAPEPVSPAATAPEPVSPADTAAEPFSPEIHILTGAEDTDPDLAAYAKDRPYITLHGYVEDMADFLCGFDLVMTASGTTLHEICALGIPCISFVIADNQIPSATAFDINNLVPCLGDLRAEGPYEEIIDKLLTVFEDYETRCACSARMQGTIDKKGAGRIADALLFQ